MSTKKIAIRCDATAHIGSGHVMRCLNLANALQKTGAQITFVCRENPGHLLGLIESSKHKVISLPSSASFSSEDLNRVDLMGVTQAEDAQQTAEILKAIGNLDWLIVDHYSLDEEWETAVRPLTKFIMVIDDLANRNHNCDLLLDQNLVEQMTTRYIGKVPVACGMLLGPEYALLQPIYAELHNRIPPRGGPIKRIFIFFSGADRDNLTGRALAAFLRLDRQDIEVDVVVNAGSPFLEDIRQQVAGYANINLHSGLPTLATLMAKADLAIGAGGVTSWERICLGLPSLVVTLSENQRAIAKKQSRCGLVYWLGHHNEIDELTIAQALGNLIQKDLDKDWSLRCIDAVDGNGVNRVCAALTVTATTPLRARHARLSDEARLLEWANDPVTRRNAFSSEQISPEVHRDWFRAHLRDVESCHFYLVETENSVAVGQVRFDFADQAWSIDYALAPHFRGRGLGRPLLEAALLKLREDESGGMVLGRVKKKNQPSCQVFESLGFAMQVKEGGDVVEYRQRL